MGRANERAKQRRAASEDHPLKRDVNCERGRNTTRVSAPKAVPNPVQRASAAMRAEMGRKTAATAARQACVAARPNPCFFAAQRDNISLSAGLRLPTVTGAPRGTGAFPGAL